MSADIDKAIPHYCINNAGIFALIGNRIKPNKLPHETLIPASTFQLISTVRLSIHKAPSFLPKQRYQFTHFGVTYEICRQIAEAFRSALDGYQGNMGTGSYLTEVEAVLLKDERHDDDTETGLFWRQQDFLFIWKE